VIALWKGAPESGPRNGYGTSVNRFSFMGDTARQIDSGKQITRHNGLLTG